MESALFDLATFPDLGSSAVEKAGCPGKRTGYMLGSFLSGTPHIKNLMLTGHCCGTPGRPISKILFIHVPFNKYLLSIYYVLGIVLGVVLDALHWGRLPHILA